MRLHGIYNCTCPDCGGHIEKLSISETEDDELTKAFNKAARWVFRDKKTTINADDLNNKNVQPLMNNTNTLLQEGMKKGISHVVPASMQRNLSENVFVFSGAKTYAELKELSGLLLDENGHIKPFNKFWQDTRTINDTYNGSYLESEYLFATQSAQMASKWEGYEQDGDRYNLQYRTANDDRVRAEHYALHDTTLPPSDPFWDKYFPPNGWRCRCTAVQVRKTKYPESDSQQAQQLGEQATTQVGANGKNSAAMFRFNPGKQQVIFPETHPYFKYKDEVKTAYSDREKQERQKEYDKLKKDSNYTDVDINSENGLKATHTGHTFDPRKGQYEKDVQNILFQNGHKIILENETGGSIGQKHIDAIFDNNKADIKAIEGSGKNTIKHAFQKAKEQGSESVILYFPNQDIFTMERLATSVAGFYGNTTYRFKEIIFIVNGKVYRY